MQSFDSSPQLGGQTISANGGLVIQLHEGRWQLFGRTDAAPMIEAAPGGVTYSAAFGHARSLPGQSLSPDLIETIVVGWAKEDGSWHLGLMLSPDLVRERGGRWCGLARWTDPTGHNEVLSAETAGRGLADVLHRPFRVVTDQLGTAQPTVAASPVYDTVPTTPPAIDQAVPTEPSTAGPLPAVLPDVKFLDPPVRVGTWSLVSGPSGLVWTRSRGWQLETGLRCAFWLVLALAFVVLAVGSLQTRFASVQPDWLPIVGFVVAAILAVNALSQLIGLITAYSVEFDHRTRMIRYVRRPVGVVKQVPFEKVNYVLVSQAALRQERMKNLPPEAPFDQVSLEAWLHLARDKGDFVEVAHLLSEGRAVHYAVRAPRHPLSLEEVDTPIHQVARLIAQALDVRALVEDRT